MMKIILPLLFPFLALAINPSGNPLDFYQPCLNASNKLESPADRDAQKVNCFSQQKRVKKSMSTCISLARILEHTSASDSLILSCLAENVLNLNVSECVNAAKKLYYSENKDRALWMCIENNSMKKAQCNYVSGEMTYPHNKNVALNFCLMKN